MRDDLLRGKDAAEATTQVLIVGLGPCGATLANYLGRYGIAAIAIDRAEEILDYPRAIGIDDEALRSFQGIGLAETLLADMVRNVPVRYLTATGRCFAELRPQGEPYGWPRRSVFVQPLAEAALRDGLRRYPGIRVLLGHELDSLVHDPTGVVATLRRADGSTTTVRADYLVGCDGGRSTVRLLLGVKLGGKTEAARWLVIDVEDDTLDQPWSTVHTHRLTPRLSIALPYGQRRFEFRIPPGESDEEVLRPEQLDRRLAEFYPDGSRRPQLKRARIYQHHARIAERFRVGRVFLAGDAAHLMPPFFGQGLNSGLRDVTNLGWKLAAVLRTQATPALLETYEQERRDHALTMVRIARLFGRIYAPRSRAMELARDVVFRLLRNLPAAHDWILQMRFKPMPRYVEGLVAPGPDDDGRHGLVGRLVPQPMVETAERQRLRLDDAIGDWFAILGLGHDPATLLAPGERAFWQGIGARLVMILPSRSPAARRAADPATTVLEDVDGAFVEWRLRRPQDGFLVLRPDRYVAAAGAAAGLNAASAALRRQIGAGPGR